MPDPTICEVEGTIAAKAINGTIAPILLTTNLNEYGWYNDLGWYLDFEAAGIAGYQLSDFPDIPMDSPLIVYEIASGFFDPNTYGNWEA